MEVRIAALVYQREQINSAPAGSVCHMGSFAHLETGPEVVLSHIFLVTHRHPSSTASQTSIFDMDMLQYLGPFSIPPFLQQRHSQPLMPSMTLGVRGEAQREQLLQGQAGLGFESRSPSSNYPLTHYFAKQTHLAGSL